MEKNFASTYLTGNYTFQRYRKSQLTYHSKGCLRNNAFQLHLYNADFQYYIALPHTFFSQIFPLFRRLMVLRKFFE